MNKLTFQHDGRSIWITQDAVTSIEYALIGSLIAVVIVAAVGTAGTRVLYLFNLVANCVTFAVSGTGSCA